MPKDDEKPHRIPLGHKVIVPDAIWGIEYTDQATATMFFHEECDTGSERMRGNKEYEERNKTGRTMLKEYVSYLEQDLDKQRYNFPNMTILIHTTKADRVETFFELIEEVVPGNLQPRFAVKSVPDFPEEPLLLPKPTDNVMAADYTRLKDGKRQPFNIMDTLRATELKKRR
jgi:hypothetical protein